MTELEIFERLRLGDHEAFEIIFRAHYAQLVGFAEGMLRRGGTAEEIVQDVMLELWRRRESLVLTESVRAYLYRATRNRVLNDLRHERVVQRGAARPDDVLEVLKAGAAKARAKAGASLARAQADCGIKGY